MNDGIRSELMARRETGALQRLAREHGMLTLREDGFRQVALGVTTVAEVLRVAPD